MEDWLDDDVISPEDFKAKEPPRNNLEATISEGRRKLLIQSNRYGLVSINVSNVFQI